jgi:hypothetical protein
VSESRLVRSAAESYWRGETHRLIDRAGCVGRLIEEAAAAGAEQVVIVAAVPDPPGLHELRPPRPMAWAAFASKWHPPSRRRLATRSGSCITGSTACA